MRLSRAATWTLLMPSSSQSRQRLLSEVAAAACLLGSVIAVHAQSPATHSRPGSLPQQLCGVAIARAKPVELNLDAGRITMSAAAPVAAGPRASDRVVLFAPPDASKRASPSALVSRKDIEVRTSLSEWSGHQFNSLFADYPGRGPILLAVNVTSKRDGSERTTSYWLPLDGTQDRDAMALNLAALEHLYTLTLAIDAEGSFRFARGTGTRAVRPTASSQADALRAIASARQCIVDRIGSDLDTNAVRWQVATVEPRGKLKGAEAEYVAVVVKSEGKPLVGAEVAFARRPHFGCFAKSDAKGVAGCELQDLHMHQHEDHGEQEVVPVVATYRGAVATGTVRAPMTLVMRGSPKGRSTDQSHRQKPQR